MGDQRYQHLFEKREHRTPPQGKGAYTPTQIGKEGGKVRSHLSWVSAKREEVFLFIKKSAFLGEEGTTVPTPRLKATGLSPLL